MYRIEEDILAATGKTVKSLLTDRELEYLSLVALGFINLDIAKILNVTNSTVKKTIETIFFKLKALNRANAVTIAFVHKIINTESLDKILLRYNINYNDYKKRVKLKQPT